MPLVATALPADDAGSTILIRLRDTEIRAGTSDMSSSKTYEEPLEESVTGTRTAVNRHFHR